MSIAQVVSVFVLGMATSAIGAAVILRWVFSDDITEIQKPPAAWPDITKPDARGGKGPSR